MKLVIFDLDNTLLTINSHEVLINILSKKSLVYRVIIRLLNCKLIIKILDVLAFHQDSRRLLSIRAIKVLPKKLIEKTLVEVHDLLVKSINQSVLNILKYFNSKNTIYKVYIISAAPDFVVMSLEEFFGVTIIASTIVDYQYKLDMHGKKHDFIDQYISHEEKFLFISDNVEDYCENFSNYIFILKNQMFLKINEKNSFLNIQSIVNDAIEIYKC